MRIDPRGQRFSAALSAVVLAAVLVTGSAWLLSAQAVVFGVGTVLGLSYAPYGLIYRWLVRPRLGPPRVQAGCAAAHPRRELHAPRRRGRETSGSPNKLKLVLYSTGSPVALPASSNAMQKVADGHEIDASAATLFSSDHDVPFQIRTSPSSSVQC